MYPGRVTRLTESYITAANTIRPRTDVVLVSGLTPIATITPTFGPRVAQMVILIAAGNPITLVTGGNIYDGFTIPTGRCCILIWTLLGSTANGWVIHAPV